MSALTDSITVDRLEADPYPIYERLRAEEPVAWVPAVGAWLVTRWSDVRHVLTSPESFTTTNDVSPLSTYCGAENVLNQEGDRHAAIRASVDDRFRRETAPAVAAHARSLAARRLQDLAHHDHADLMAEYFEPVSVATSMWLLGLDDVDGIDTAGLTRWSSNLTAALYNPTKDTAAHQTGAAVSAEMERTLTPYLTRLLTRPDDSPLSALVHAGLPGTDASGNATQALATLRMMTSAVREPGWLAGNTLHALLTHPEQMDALRADLGLLGAAVHEGIRWAAPVGTVGRLTTRPLVLGGRDLPAGAPVAPGIASANRDESVFPDADRFDLRRARTTTPLSLGFGRHECLAASVVPAIVAGALHALLERFPHLSLAQESQPCGWKFRKFDALPVGWRDRSSARR
ncbi:cytochrome P450 [Streptomyces spectabilis]|uniref:Cytochrome P450 n=1 Tax=Streptomyces spectabilis TaxID=68270 RepID=A0A5P2XEG3_STRST|nr:cytochrome P450 [Streptomyces spectabilis]MBB5105400.1 cytochrome P450 [Streptomyces spectabilis]MCI3906593.1 cytochrome P450 [Streptomyces spectabilis]QEV63417.1 cytochrome P450 [Streptomyces spectabilis]GGV21350.1 cytochrome P450 [Streptomyces spectabilis]